MNEYRSAIPFTFGIIPIFGKIYKVEEGKVITYSGDGSSAHMDFQPINATSRMSRNGNHIVLDVNCDNRQGKFKETRYDNIINCDQFENEIREQIKKTKTS